jgi:hypothetical protein
MGMVGTFSVDILDEVFMDKVYIIFAQPSHVLQSLDFGFCSRQNQIWL